MQCRAFSPSKRSVHYSRPLHQEVDLLIKVNLKLVLPHQRQLRLLNVDPGVLDYPILRITTARDLYLCVEDIKGHVCDMLWETLTISINKDSFRLTFDVYKNDKYIRYPLRDDDTIYQTIVNWEQSWACPVVRFTARPPTEWWHRFQHTLKKFLLRDGKRLSLPSRPH